jgi:hypothetical protein
MHCSASSGGGKTLLRAVLRVRDIQTLLVELVDGGVCDKVAVSHRKMKAGVQAWDHRIQVL